MCGYICYDKFLGQFVKVKTPCTSWQHTPALAQLFPCAVPADVLLTAFKVIVGKMSVEMYVMCIIWCS